MESPVQAAPGEGSGARIVIYGAPGAGKTTLAEELATALGLRHFCLDRMRLRPGWTFASDAELRRAFESGFADSPRGWVVDSEGGANAAFVRDRADTIIWLRLPMRTSHSRLIRRGVRSAVHPEMVGAGNWTGPGTLFFTALLLVRTTRTWREQRRETVRRIRARRPGTRVIVLRSQRDADAFLAAVRARTNPAGLRPRG